MTGSWGTMEILGWLPPLDTLKGAGAGFPLPARDGAVLTEGTTCGALFCPADSELGFIGMGPAGEAPLPGKVAAILGAGIKPLLLARLKAGAGETIELAELAIFNGCGSALAILVEFRLIVERTAGKLGARVSVG